MIERVHRGDRLMRERKILDHGYYSLFKNDRGRKVLVLDGKQWFLWTESSFGPTLIYCEPWNIEENNDYKIIKQGNFFLEDIENDMFRPYLYLEENGAYMEIILPQGLPGTIDDSKSILISDRVLPAEFVENYDDFKASSHQFIDG